MTQVRWLSGALGVGLDGAGPRDRIALREPRFASEGKDAHGIALTSSRDELLLTTQITGSSRSPTRARSRCAEEVHVGRRALRRP